MVAIRCKPVVQDFAAKPARAGKSKRLIIGAAMRKLVHIMYGVLRSGKPFNPGTKLADCLTFKTVSDPKDVFFWPLSA